MRIEEQLPEATLDLLLPRLAEYEVTRLANITGLDRIGIPVWMAIRPNSRSLAVSQGKGLSQAAAKASALCESVETWYAERFNGPLCLARYHDLYQTGLQQETAVADPSQLPLCRDSLYSPFEPIPWVCGEDLLRGGRIWVPFELVHADATIPRPHGSGCFVFSTNGLASGSSLAHATLAALCEVLERDAHAVWKAQGDAHAIATRVDCATITDRNCLWLMEKFREAEVEVMIWNMTNDIKVPVFRVVIYDRWADSPLAPYPAAYGAASHPCRETALAKALAEAAQSRLTSIAGARDDMSRATYQHAQSAESRARHSAQSQLETAIEFDSVPSVSFDDIDHAIDRVIDKLRAAGISSIVRIQITPDDAPLAVVRIVVPGLESLSSSPSYLPGSRAREMYKKTKTRNKR
jgi:YcaO-like protein with predicted kinase domain